MKPTQAEILENTLIGDSDAMFENLLSNDICNEQHGQLWLFKYPDDSVVLFNLFDVEENAIKDHIIGQINKTTAEI